MLCNAHWPSELSIQCSSFPPSKYDSLLTVLPAVLRSPPPLRGSLCRQDGRLKPEGTRGVDRSCTWDSHELTYSITRFSNLSELMRKHGHDAFREVTRHGHAVSKEDCVLFDQEAP